MQTSRRHHQETRRRLKPGHGEAAQLHLLPGGLTRLIFRCGHRQVSTQIFTAGQIARIKSIRGQWS